MGIKLERNSRTDSAMAGVAATWLMRKRMWGRRVCHGGLQLQGAQGQGRNTQLGAAPHHASVQTVHQGVLHEREKDEEEDNYSEVYFFFWWIK